MRPAFVRDIVANGTLPHYDLKLAVEPSTSVVSGTERIVFPNHTGTLLHDIALRLYPNFPRDVFGKGGDVHMTVSSASVNDRLVDVRSAAQGTAMLLPLESPLQPEQTITLVVHFNATIKSWSDGTWPLPSYYPMLAVHDASGWRLDVTRFADHVFAASALYAVEITVPSRYTIATSGSTIGKVSRNRYTTYSVRTGPIREFALSVGDFSIVHDVGGMDGDVAVNVYVAQGSSLDTQQIARVAAGALGSYDRRFGRYPYRELNIHLLPGAFDGGDEYPGLILLYCASQVGIGTRYVTAHEVAHQWWYGVIGDDIYHQPWLDEAFAQWSGILYDEDVEGSEVARSDWEREVLRRYQAARADGDLPIGLGIEDYHNFNVYYHTVYGKGPVFLRMLREQLGDETFFHALQALYAQHRYGIVTTLDVQQAFEVASSQKLGPLFQKWVTGQ